MNYEEFRAQEPPQLRLLRLRGLFDLLVDHDTSVALAGGRAKQMWRARASRARYGAGGELATGSMVQDVTPTRTSDAARKHIREWISGVSDNRYASELLAKCRTRHAELVAQQEAAEGHAHAPTPWRDTIWHKWHAVTSMVQEPAQPASSWSLWPWTRVSPSGAPSVLMQQESGWSGSRVWGLRAHSGRKASQDTPENTTKGSAAERERQREIEWEGFVAYAEFQERELFQLFNEMDTNHDGVIDTGDLRRAFEQAGIRTSAVVLHDFLASLASSGIDDVHELSEDDLFVTFPEFRDYLLLLPRKPTLQESFKFYQVRKAVGLFGTEGIFAKFGALWGKTPRGATWVNGDGDTGLAGELNDEADGEEVVPCDENDDDEHEGVAPPCSKSDMIQLDVAAKFLLAGGLAGAVSRTATAPLDRLKVFLITSQSARSAASQVSKTGSVTRTGLGALAQGVVAIYQDGGLRGFWLGNGLNCMKIIPESAIKFFTYEYMKRFFAKYVDGVSDSRDVSGMSRFISGGLGGIVSQLSIYPVETLKTRLMSTMGEAEHPRGMPLLFKTAREMWAKGGVRAYYRGLGAGLLGVFPYSAIDMSMFEGSKLFYLRYTGKEEPGVLALLAFGSFSGSVGAATVYPLNLVRTRLQASGTSAHPTLYVRPTHPRYKSFWDATYQTYQREGFLGFYRGLVPSLAKVVPAVSISYVVYDHVRCRD